MLGVLLCVLGCENMPREFDGEITTPLTPPLQIRWKLTRPQEPLPPGWAPGGTYMVPVVIDGKTYNVAICVATNARVPDCIYVKTGSCSVQEGWTQYCKIIVVEDDGSPTGSPCTPFGTLSYQSSTDITTCTFTNTCTHLYVVPDLADILITHPSAPTQPLPSDEFRLVYGDLMPSRSVVHFSTSSASAIWNMAMLNINEFVLHDGVTDQVIAGAIHEFSGDAPPIAALVVNEQVQQIRFVHDPS